MANGNVDLNFTLNSNANRRVKFNKVNKRPEDSQFQEESSQIPPQTHY
jgi:hypothetical protein